MSFCEPISSTYRPIPQSVQPNQPGFEFVRRDLPVAFQSSIQRIPVTNSPPQPNNMNTMLVLPRTISFDLLTLGPGGGIPLSILQDPDQFKARLQLVRGGDPVFRSCFDTIDEITVEFYWNAHPHWLCPTKIPTHRLDPCGYIVPITRNQVAHLVMRGARKWFECFFADPDGHYYDPKHFRRRFIPEISGRTGVRISDLVIKKIKHRFGRIYRVHFNLSEE
ncbi:hypothetical protein C8Q75DRAFT_509935 [Abortiporus biennis]|nr:hypothetical protein C8Q75DRAFT_509935 [Abortiporus biennis]